MYLEDKIQDNNVPDSLSYHQDDLTKSKINQKRLSIENKVKNTTIESLIDSSDYYAREELRKALRLIKKVENAVGNLEDYAEQKQVVSGENTEEVYNMAHELAQDMYIAARENEPSISRDLDSLENINCILIGKEYRVKELKSLKDKIVGDAIDEIDNESTSTSSISYELLEKSANNIKDTIRYTYVIDDDVYTKKTEEMLNTLEKMGYSIVRFSNVWSNDKYKGINCILSTSNNTVFEIQFHTESSLLAKELNHLMYEIARNKNSSETIATISNDAQTCINAAIINLPDGVLEFDYNSYSSELSDMVNDSYNEEESNIIIKR